MISREAAKTYGHRNRILKQMGFRSYEHYIKSPLWGSIRTQQLREHPFCWACGNRAEQVHHGNYDRQTLEGKNRKALYSVCEPCHEHAELAPGEGKVSPQRATARLKALRAEKQGHAAPKTRRPRQSHRREQREALALDGARMARFRFLLDEL